MLNVNLHCLIRENSQDERTYNRYMDSLKQSVLTAFYTPPTVVESLAQTLRNHGITPARLLEPPATDLKWFTRVLSTIITKVPVKQKKSM